MSSQLSLYIPLLVKIIKRPTIDKLTVIAVQALLTASTFLPQANTSTLNVSLLSICVLFFDVQNLSKTGTSTFVLLVNDWWKWELSAFIEILTVIVKEFCVLKFCVSARSYQKLEVCEHSNAPCIHCLMLNLKAF